MNTIQYLRQQMFPSGDNLSVFSKPDPFSIVAYAGAFLAFLLLLQTYSASSRYLADVPIPGGASWLWGHEKVVFDASVGLAFARWLNTLGSHVIRIRGALFKPDIVVVADPLALAHIMQKRIYDYPHSAVVRPRVARLLGKSLGWVEGESEHKRMRQLVATSLASDNIKKGSHDVFTAAENMKSVLASHVLDNDGSVMINVLDWSNKATLDVIGRFGFRHDFEGGFSEEGQKIVGAWRGMAKVAISSKGFIALMLLRRFPILNSLPLAALQAQGFVRQTIHDGVGRELLRRSKVSEDTSQATDLLSRLILAHDEGKISTDELKDHITMFILAGSETTSQTLGYAIWELAKHRDKQTRLREEIMSLPVKLTYDDVQLRMPYLDAVARETFRVHPAAPNMERVALKDDCLPLRHPITNKKGDLIKEVFIKAGQTVIIPIHAINRQNSVWGDGTVFRPERWMEPLPPQDLLTKGWSNTLAFSDGPRNCIGYRLAIFQFKVILQTLIRQFEFNDTGAELKHRFASSMTPVVVGQEEKGPFMPINVTIL